MIIVERQRRSCLNSFSELLPHVAYEDSIQVNSQINLAIQDSRTFVRVAAEPKVPVVQTVAVFTDDAVQSKGRAG